MIQLTVQIRDLDGDESELADAMTAATGPIELTVNGETYEVTIESGVTQWEWST